MKSCQRQRIDDSASDPLDAIVDAYLAKNAEAEAKYLKYYIIQPTLAAAVTKSAMAELPGGGRFPHQRRILHSALVEAKEALLKVNFRRVRSFDELHNLVGETIGPIRSIGPLTIYDTAHRLGAYLKLHPKFVYLQAGVRLGAKALGLDHRASKLAMSALPKAFQRLRPDQVENCLCIYKDDLKALRKK